MEYKYVNILAMANLVLSMNSLKNQTLVRDGRIVHRLDKGASIVMGVPPTRWMVFVRAKKHLEMDDFKKHP